MGHYKVDGKGEQPGRDDNESTRKHGQKTRWTCTKQKDNLANDQSMTNNDDDRRSHSPNDRANTWRHDWPLTVVFRSSKVNQPRNNKSF